MESLQVESPQVEIIVTAADEKTTASAMSRLWTFWVTSINGKDGRTDHAVPEDELATGSGRYTAICGAVVNPASLTTPPGWQCARCVMLLRLRTRCPGRHGHRHAGRKPGWFARVLGWNRS